MKKRSLKVYLLLGLASVLMAQGLLFLKAESIIPGLLSIYLSWISYFVAHYVENGKIVDGVEVNTLESEKFFHEFRQAFEVMPLIVLCMMFSLYGLNQSNFPVSALGLYGAVIGYTVAHREVNDCLI